MDLDGRQCAALQAVLQSGSFERAAEILHITPSAVSQRVRALETTLGEPLVVRSRPCRPTSSGRRLLQFLLRVRALEQDLQADLDKREDLPVALAIAVNADTLGSWLLPALAPFLRRERILLDLVVDDQDHTYALLEAGLALGCISTEAQAMRGCTAAPLGSMRYRCMASPAFRAEWFAQGMTRAAARKAPVVAFNRKDRLQADFLQRHFGLPDGAYPVHAIPASEPFMQAIALGLGWGMLPELQAHALCAEGRLVDLAPQRAVDVALYWHCWKVQAPRMERLSAAVVDSARRLLR
ncbi:MAG TPA: LysR family transcriptional regulator ArgP [Noviherbaspirillum sp.]|jgi:LysR family transcriptional regulator (chromosome initiation inhibitor)|uniref:LysR family transcriptional regulator ArgP n=1 Tax=Noviherbaspirillum sp. TaxID=1926288 RepID=UPI002F94E202